MIVNDNAQCLNQRVALRFFASRLAPTVLTVTTTHFARNNIPCGSEPARDGLRYDAFIQVTQYR
jgi:hypothetical protein